MAQVGLREPVQNIRPVIEHVVIGFDHYIVDGSKFRYDPEKSKLPFNSGSVKQFTCDMVLHKASDFIGLMNDMQRCLQYNGILNITVPLFPHPTCWDDPMTVRAFTKATWLYFDEREWAYKDNGEKYGISPFRMVSISGESSIINVRMIK